MVVEIDDVVDAVFVEVDVVEAEIVENDGVVVNEWGCFLKNMSKEEETSCTALHSICVHKEFDMFKFDFDALILKICFNFYS